MLDVNRATGIAIVNRLMLFRYRKLSRYTSLIWGNRCPRLKVTRKGSSRLVPISPFSSNLFRFASLFSGMPRFVLICSDFFRFVPTRFQSTSVRVRSGISTARERPPHLPAYSPKQSKQAQSEAKPICFQNKSKQIRATPFCRPVLQFPEATPTANRRAIGGRGGGVHV